MSREYNEEAFTPEDVDAGLLNDLIKYLMTHNERSEKSFYDIHITTDGYCSIVQWVNVPYSDDHYNGEFVFKDYDEVITKELRLPEDNSIEYVPIEYYNDRIDELKEEFPNWKNYQKI